MQPNPHDNPEASQPVRVIDHARLLTAVKDTVAASTGTLATILDSALPDDVMAVTVVNRDTAETVHYNPTGAATTSNARLMPDTTDGRGESITFVGSKAELDLVQLIGTGSADVDVLVYVPKRLS